MKRASPLLYFLGLVFAGLSFFVPMTSYAASYSCRFSCMHVRVGTCHQNFTGLDLDNSHIYEKQEQSPVVVDVADSIDAPACSAGACTQACRSACGGWLVSDRTESSWLNGERACLNVFPDYMAVANDRCDSFDGTETRSFDLITLDYVRLQGDVARPLCTVRSTPAPTPTAGTGSSDTVPTPAACHETTPTQQPAAGSPRGTCTFSCIHPGEQITSDLPNVREHASSVPGSGTTQVHGSIVTGSGESVSASCLQATFEQRTGSSCTPGGHCDCEQQCVSACGSDTHGKSYCFLGADDPRQVAICATSAAQGHAPTCGNGSPTALTNPLGTTSISELIARLIRAITGIAGSMALLMFVVGGVMWMTAEGSDRVGTAQTILKNATIGLALTFLSYSIVSLFLSVLGL